MMDTILHTTHRNTEPSFPKLWPTFGPDSARFVRGAPTPRPAVARWISAAGAWALGLLLMGTSSAQAEGRRITQTFTLSAGWNSIWLEVTPSSADGSGTPAAPAEVFDNPAITRVAAFFPAQGPVEFVSQPALTFNQDAWQVWYRDDVARQSRLISVLGNRGYLVHATAPITLAIEGEVGFHRIRWQPDSYNLAGFGIVPGAEPTFERFFEGSRAHRPLNAFRLVDDHWVGVSPTDTLEPGKAYWIYSAGPSDFQGPLQVSVAGIDELDFGASIHDLELTLANTSTRDVLHNRLERWSNADGFELVTVLAPRPAEFTRTEGPAVTSLALDDLPAGETTHLTLRAKRNWVTPPVARTNLYRLASDAGTYFWIPARATRSELADGTVDVAAEARSQGLWVGEALIRQVAHIASPSPATSMESTADSLSLRFLLHVDASGQVRLLKQVTLMRRKPGSDVLDPGLVLVTDERRIPLFEGIRHRGDRLVGQRLETASYDLPRRSALQSPPLPPHPLPTDFDRTQLEEDYLTRLDLEGAVGRGKTAKTRPGSMVLDPWHRTHPFRHAFHERHRQGQRIVRDMMFRFDTTTSDAALAETPRGVDVLSGAYTESIEGLSKPGEKLWMSGPFQCRRISTVAELDGN